MSVLTAMLLDAYRELNSKRLFWIILGISGLVAITFASIGFDATGMSMFFGLMHVDNDLLTRHSAVARILYRSLFSTFIVGIWLAWIATVLALISTSTIFPDFLSGGAIELLLARPIGRVRLFVLKYVSSLLFVLLQVSLFCLCVFLCMGLRLGDWEWKIFAAVPLLLLFYSYLYSINVLFGVWTRSSVTALLVTFVFWASIFGVNEAEMILNQVRTDLAVQIETADESIQRVETSLAALRRNPIERDGVVRARLDSQLARARAERDDKAEMVAKLDRWHGPTRSMQSLMPKTSETIALLDRWLTEDTDVNLLDIFRGSVAVDPEGHVINTDQTRHREVERRLEQEYDARSLARIAGTSLLFELIVLAMACTIFVRRDY